MAASDTHTAAVEKESGPHCVSWKGVGGIHRHPLPWDVDTQRAHCTLHTAHVHKHRYAHNIHRHQHTPREREFIGPKKVNSNWRYCFLS